MQRSRRMIGSIRFCLVAYACVATGVAAQTPLAINQADVPPPGQLVSASRDSIASHALGEGAAPSVQVAAKFWDLTGTRRALATFQADDDAYVLVGHIDADGGLRIVFPSDPADAGFVKGRTLYKTPEFIAGFTGENAYKYRTERALIPPNPIDSYDRGLSYLFVIASRRPMHFDKFTNAGTWGQYEVTDEAPIIDPCPIIRDIASDLISDKSQTYTISFASYLRPLSPSCGPADQRSKN